MEKINIYSIDNTDILYDIKNILDKIDEEFEKEQVDKKKVFDLRYQQFIKGLYLSTGINNMYTK